MTVQVNGNGTLGRGGFADQLGGMHAGVMAPPRPVPPLLTLPRPGAKQIYSTSPSLSLGPPLGLEAAVGQREISQTAESEQQQQKNKEEEYESRSGSDNMEGGSGDDQDPDHPPRKKRYHRHTPRQIQEMEMLFKECPHPDDKQRQHLSKELGLEPRQVKFWFQNRRTQMKAQTERAENSLLRQDNDKLRSENILMREALKNPTCQHCGGPATIEMSLDEQQLRIENCRLKDELDRVSSLAAKYLGRPIPTHVPSLTTTPFAPLPLPSSSLDLQVGGSSFGQLHPSPPPGCAMDIVAQGPSVVDVATRPGGLTEAEKPLVVELAVTAMEELLGMAQANEPLWLPGPDHGGKLEQLNYDEYMRQFPRGIGLRPQGLKTEATRETGMVMNDAVSLVETLMDSSQWMEVFPCMVSRALTVDVLSTGVNGNRNGALQLMYAELQVLSPLVPTREIYFLRYCKQHAEGVWAVVDVSVDSLRDNPPPSLMRCRRRPSGMLIQDTPNGYSKVTVVEHMEYDDRAVHRMYRDLVNSGMAFGAQRWVAVVQRQCERLASLLATNIDLGGVPSADGRRSMLKLAQRMTNNFCAGVSASTVHTWTTLSGSGDDDVRVMTRKSVDNPGEPHGIVLSAATSLWLPVSPQRVFEFLRDERLRSEWDILSNGGLVTEMAHIAKGQDPGNSVSLLRVNPMNANQSNMLILQESCTDVSGALLIYAPVDIPAMNLVLRGGDPAYVALLPSGFAILPDGPENRSRASSMMVSHDSTGQLTDSSPRTTGGSLLTVAFQILVSTIPSARLSLESVETVNNLISCTVQRIKAALRCEDA